MPRYNGQNYKTFLKISTGNFPNIKLNIKFLDIMRKSVNKREAVNNLGFIKIQNFGVPASSISKQSRERKQKISQYGLNISTIH